jgi:protein-S-isoprenylcysteine O-methyltransferase Ste14
MARVFWISFGIGSHLLLLVTVWFLFPFLVGDSRPELSSAPLSWWWVDALLALQFGIGHSLLLRPIMRDRLENFLPRPLYGCFFTAMTCLSLLGLIACWQSSGVVLYRLEGWAERGMRGAYLLSWGALLYTLGLTGYGFQTGWTPFWAWVHRRQPPPRRFTVRGAYKILRHPVYLAFLAQVWLTPLLTLDRALLTAIFTVYIFVGSWLKDRRLLFYLRDTYADYQARVPGYPLAIGPLGRVRPRTSEKAIAAPQPVKVPSQ